MEKSIINKTFNKTRGLEKRNLLSKMAKIAVNKAAMLRVVDPSKQFRAAMAAKRREFMQEHAVFLQTRKDQKVAEKLAETQRRAAERQRLVVFKTQRAIEEREVDAYAGAPLVEIVSCQKDSNSPKDMDKDSVWELANRANKDARRKAFLQRRKDQAEHKMAGLVHLYHAASDFYTYQNMDEKINTMMQ